MDAAAASPVRAPAWSGGRTGFVTAPVAVLIPSRSPMRPARLVVLVAALLLTAHVRGASLDVRSAVPNEQDARILEPGLAVERELAGGDAPHIYQVPLA